MPGEWKAPDEQWDEHGWPIGRSLMALAREHGWSFRTIEGHPHGELRCPAGEHSSKVPGTPKSGEAKFIDLKKLIRDRCAHGTGNAPKLERARKLTETTRSLLESAEEGADLYTAARRGDEALSEAEHIEAMIAIEVTEENIEELTRTRDALLNEAVIAPAAPAAREILELVNEARGRAKEVRHVLKPISKPLSRPILEEITELEGRGDAVERDICP